MGANIAREAVYVEPVAEDFDIEASGLLDGLEGQARTERAELIEWLLGEGFTVDQIRGEVSPMLMPAGRIVGDDGVYVSARQICEETGIDLELLEAMQPALGLPRADDPDAAIHLRADIEAAARVKIFLDMGLSREQVIAVARVLGHGLAQTAEAMRQVVLEAVCHPGPRNSSSRRPTRAGAAGIAAARPAVRRRAAGAAAPHVGDRGGQRRRAGRRHAAGRAQCRRGVRRPRRLHPARRGGAAGGAGESGQPAPSMAHDVVAPPVRFIKTIGDAVMFVSPDPVALLRTALELLAAAEKYDDFPQMRVGMSYGLRREPRGGLVRQSGERGQPGDRRARPGTVLVAEPAREAIGAADGFAWSFAGARHFKGVKGEIKVFRARRSDD